jgi:hypothetical protein
MAVDTQTDEHTKTGNLRRRDDWGRNLAKLRGQLTAEARNDEERAEIDAQFESLREAGPDFKRFHRGSGFDAPPQHKLDRNEATRIKVAYDVVDRGLYEHSRNPRGRAPPRT